MSLLQSDENCLVGSNEESRFLGITKIQISNYTLPILQVDAGLRWNTSTVVHHKAKQPHFQFIIPLRWQYHLIFLFKNT